MKTRAVFLFLLILILSLFLMRKAEFSYYNGGNRNVITIEIELKGSYQEAIEEVITNPLEEELLSMGGIKKLLSLSEDEKAYFTIVFQDSIPLDRSYLEVREIVDRVYRAYPVQTQKPLILKSDSEAFPVFILMLEGERLYDEKQLSKICRSIKGVGRVDTGGAPSRDVVLEYRKGIPAHYKLKEEDIASLIRDNNRIVSINPGRGPLLTGDFRYTGLSSFSGQNLKEGLDLGELVHPVLKDAQTSIISRFNGEERTILWIRKAGDANTIVLCRKLRDLKGKLPPFTTLYDRGLLIEESLKDAGLAVLAGIAAVLLVTGLMMGNFRTALLLCLNIPFSLCAALGVISLTGREIDMMVLSGTALGTGMVIDGGAVFLECGYLESRKPVFYSLLSTLLVFTTLLFAPPDIKEQYAPLVLTVSLILMVSLFYLYRILPGLMARQKTFLPRASCLPVRKVLEHVRKYPFHYGGLVLLLMLLNLAALGRLPIRMDMHLNDNSLRFSLEYPSGTTRDAVMKDLMFLEEAMKDWKVLRYFSSEYQAEKARFQLKLKDPAAGVREELKIRIRGKSKLCGGSLFFKDSESPEGYEIILTGYRRDLLYDTADSLEWYLQTGMNTGTVIRHYKLSPPSLILCADPAKLSDASLLPATLFNAVSAALSHPVRSKWHPSPSLGFPQERYDIRICQEESIPDDRKLIRNLHIFPDEGPGRILEHFVQWKENPDYGRIYHFNGQRGVSLSLSSGEKSSRDFYRKAEVLLNKFPLPQSIRISHGENQKQNRNSAGTLLLCVCLSLTLIFLLLLYLFESLTMSLFLFAQIPLCLIFPMGALYLLDLSLSAPVFFAMILICGISVNNGIVLYSGIGGKNPDFEEFIIAFERRSSSLLTAFATTLAGIFPLLFSGSANRNFLFGMTLTICSGLTGSLIFLIVLTPLCFGRSVQLHHGDS